MDLLQKRTVENLTYWAIDILLKQKTVYAKIKPKLSNSVYLKEYGTIKFSLPRRRGNSTIVSCVNNRLYELHHEPSIIDNYNVRISHFINGLKGIIIIDGNISSEIKETIYNNTRVELIIIIGEM